jgi:hypothetical protein
MAESVHTILATARFPAHRGEVRRRRAEQGEGLESKPTREVCVKGPGLIFKGNPKNYLTEIQLPFKD